MSICQFVKLSNCQFVILPIRHFVKLCGILVALEALAVAKWRAGLTCGGLGRIPVALGASAVAICRACLRCGGLGGILVALGAAPIRRAVCHEGLEQTGGRMMRRSGFNKEF